MKIIILSSLLLVLSQSAYGAQQTLGGLLGFDQGSAVVGFDYDYRTKKSTAWHGYLLYGMTAESFENVAKNEIQKIAVGGGMKIFFGPKRWRLSVMPGLGATMLTIKQSSVLDNTVFVEVNDTLFGPVLKFDALYRISKKYSAGLNYTIQANWFSSNFASSLSFLTASFRLGF